MKEIEPKRCPKCGHPLYDIIPETFGEYYRWNGEVGKYEVDDGQVIMIFRCPECDEAIGEYRSDGLKWGIIPETE